jgi:serine protease Do
MEPPRGALVASVARGSPAASAGIQAGDVIVSFAGKPIETMRDLPRIVALTPTGKSVEVVVLRDNHERTIDAVVAERDTSRQVASNGGGDSPAATDTLGLALAPVSDEVRKRFDLPDDASGVVVVEVDPRGPAAEVGLRPGDVITKAAQALVTKPSDVAKAIDDAVGAKRGAVLLLVERGGNALFVAVPVGKA